MKWEFLKYKIRYFCIKFSSKRKKERDIKEKTLQDKLSGLYIKIYNLEDEFSKNNTIIEVNQVKSDLKEIEDYKVNGLIMRSKEKWFELGETNSKYFLNLEKYHASKKSVRKLLKADNTYTEDKKEILSMLKQYYEELYSSKCSKNLNDIEIYINQASLPILSDLDWIMLDEPINLEECYETLKKFKSNKSPGNDGITADFYKKFWPLIGFTLLESFQESIREGGLSH